MSASSSIGVARRPRGDGLGRVLRRAAVLAALALVAFPAGALAGGKPSGLYKQTNLVSDIPGVANITDPDLKNPWGLAAGAKTPLWVADNGTDKATIYPGGTPQMLISKASLVVDIPGGAPTGEVYNGTDGFVLGSSGPAKFLFSSEAGRITAWNSGTAAQTVFTAPDGAIYKGLTLASTNKNGPRLYATDFHNGKVDVFDSSFAPVHTAGAFTDPNLPAGFAPFGIQEIGGFIVVTYAMQDEEREDDVKGPGLGYVDVYRPDGSFVERLISKGELNAPWGLVLAPSGFGVFSHALLVGNFGDGRINAYDPKTGDFLGSLESKFGPIEIDGLWGLRFGNGVTGTPQTLLFSAGINDEANGLLGKIRARSH